MQLPFEIRNQIIQCIGLCFHYKDNVEAFFISCGVARRLASKDKNQPKFVWTRLLLNELDDMENGELIQRRILTELCKLRNLPDKDVPNPDAGLDALRKLKELAYENKFEIEEVKNTEKLRKSINEEKQKTIKDRENSLSELRKKFIDSFSSTNRQKSGYILEDILEALFPIFDLEYRKSYRTETQQIDGHFKFEGFDYLVEAKWTENKPDEAEISSFKRKVSTKLESTRGIFMSVNGFRQEVIRSFEEPGNNIIFFSGEDLMYILEGRIDLREILHIKIEKGAQEGLAYVPVTSIL